MHDRHNRNAGRLHAPNLLALCCLMALAISPQAMASAVGAPAAPAGQASSSAGVEYRIAAGPLDVALNQFSSQSGLQVVYSPELVAGKQTRGLSGRHAPQDALRRLLQGADLGWDAVSATMYVLKREAPQARATPPRNPAPAEDDRAIVGLPALMVEGARTLNTDITRTRNDPQPYVVFDRELIERSGATSLEQLLQQRLPMNTSVGSTGAGMSLTYGDQPSSSSINLRGLGTTQTLILIDGHRMSSAMIFGQQTQGEISGFPLAAIERIEILPSTASGIYGGSATGGVINIITRKDYSGGEVRMTYDNTFSSDTATRKMDVVFGHNFNDGKTSLLLSAGYSDANALLERDRNLMRRGYDRIASNNPDMFISPWDMPLGRTPNIVSADGSDLVLRSGEALGSPYTWVPYGYAGVASDGGAALVANAGEYNFEPPNNTLGLRRSLYTEPTVKSGNLVVRHRFSDTLQAFADLSSSQTRRSYMTGGSNTPFLLAADSPYNPFTTAVRGRLALSGDSPQESVTEHGRAVLGLIKQLPRDWQMSMDYTWDRTRLQYSGGNNASNYISGVVNGGNVDILRDLEAFPIDVSSYLAPVYDGTTTSTMKDANVRFSGPLGSLPGGLPVFSVALAQREEGAPGSTVSQSSSFHIHFPARSTSVSSAYMEYRLPLFSKANARPGLQELELQLAARYENYISRSGQLMTFAGDYPVVLPDPVLARNEFSSVDSTIALRWRPIRDLALRLSHGTGFQPPSLYQLTPIGTAVHGVMATASSDPRRGGTNPGFFAFTAGGNPNLKPERSKSWSAGLIYTPEAVSGLRVSVDYTRLEKTDNIGTIPGQWQGVINNEASFPDRVVRGPNLPGDPVGWAGPIIHIDWSPLNLASAKLEAWDVQVDYRFDTNDWGAFDLLLVGTWQPEYAIQLMDGLPMTDYVGVGSYNPLELKINAGLTWNYSAWRVGWNTSYFDSYLVGDDDILIASQGNGGKVASQIYHDAFVNYDFDLSGRGELGWLAGTQVQFGVRNLFNQAPPFDAASSSTSYYSLFGNPRLASYYLTLTKRF